MKPIEVLEKSRLLRELERAHLERLAEIARASTLAPAETLVRQGNAESSIYVLGTGSVRVVKERDGRVEEVARMGSGATLGEMAFVDGEARSTSVEAVERTEVVTLPGDALRELLRSDVELRAAFYEAVARVLARRLRGATDDVAALRAVLKRH